MCVCVCVREVCIFSDWHFPVLQSKVYTRTPTLYLDFTLQPGAMHVQPVPSGMRTTFLNSDSVNGFLIMEVSKDVRMIYSRLSSFFSPRCPCHDTTLFTTNLVGYCPLVAGNRTMSDTWGEHGDYIIAFFGKTPH